MRIGKVAMLAIARGTNAGVQETVRGRIIHNPFKLMALSLPLVCCAAGSHQEVVDATLSQCLDPRPELCTLEFRPVCAVMVDGHREEFSNGCSACSNPDVSGWTAGTCSN